MPDCPIPLMARDLLTKLGATLFLEGERSHPHRQMILTENRKGQIESEAEIEDLIGPGCVEYQGSRSGQRCPASGYSTRSQEMAVVHCRGH